MSNEDTSKVSKLKGSRRSFLMYSGATVAVTGLLLAGCKDDESPGSNTIQLGGGDVGILNYALVLEQLEAAFYTAVVATPFQGITQEESVIMQDLKNHEVVHRDFLRAALGNNAIPTLNFNFQSIDFNSRESVLNTAKTFEDLGVAAYNGAGKFLESPDFLLIAGKIVSVEGRHAAAIRSLLSPKTQSFAGSDIIDSNGLDRAFEPQMVLEAASSFIVERISANNLPRS